MTGNPETRFQWLHEGDLPLRLSPRVTCHEDPDDHAGGTAGASAVAWRTTGTPRTRDRILVCSLLILSLFTCLDLVAPDIRPAITRKDPIQDPTLSPAGPAEPQRTNFGHLGPPSRLHFARNSPESAQPQVAPRLVQALGPSPLGAPTRQAPVASSRIWRNVSLLAQEVNRLAKSGWSRNRRSITNQVI